jgi:ATPase subunit of ABC transporter with duplicated ATPase domains
MSKEHVTVSLLAGSVSVAFTVTFVSTGTRSAGVTLSMTTVGATFDTVSVAILGQPWESTTDRPMGTLSGGEQKRFALELLLRGDDEVLLLDEPDNFLDVPAKRWLEARLNESPKSVLYVSHDRELLAQTAQRVVAVEGGSAWVHGGGFATWHVARLDRHERLDELRRRWDEEQKLRGRSWQAEGVGNSGWHRGTRRRSPAGAS